ncbi:MAG: hypothetical protein AAF213_09800 [Pseudomonadota bacterium]
MVDTLSHGQRRMLTRRHVLTGLTGFISAAALPGGPGARAQNLGLDLFNDPVGLFRARFPGVPARLELPLASDSWQWFERHDTFISNGLVATVMVTRFHWTSKFQIAMQVNRAQPADVLLADDFKIMRKAFQASKRVTIDNASTFEAFNTKCLQLFMTEQGEDIPRPLSLNWVVPYPTVMIVAKAMVADTSQFQSREAQAFNQSFEVFPPTS